MINIRKRSNLLYPITHTFFPQSVEDVGDVGRWAVIQCVQANDAVKELYGKYTVYCTPYHTLITDLRQPIDTLWKQVEHARQCKIQQARDMALEIQINQYPTSKLYRFIQAFYANKGLYNPRMNNFEQFCKRCDIFTAMLDGELAIAHVILKDLPFRVMAYYSCFNFDADISKADRGTINSYLHWWEVQYYQERGVQMYDWGGVTLDKQSSAYGVTKFKQKFGGTLLQEWNMLLLGDFLRPSWALIKMFLEKSGQGFLNLHQATQPVGSAQSCQEGQR